MDFETAKSILIKRVKTSKENRRDTVPPPGSFSCEEVSERCLFCFDVYAKAEDGFATLNGEFTPDELEAIAAWMRNPQACMKEEYNG